MIFEILDIAVRYTYILNKNSMQNLPFEILFRENEL